LAPADIPRVEEVGMHLPLLICALALSSLAGALVGLIPALRVASTDHVGALTKDNAAETRSGFALARFGSRELVIVGEIAMAMVLLVGAGLLIRSFTTLVSVNPGYDAHNVLTFQIVLPQGRVPDPRNLYDDVMTRLESIPAVQAIGATDVLPIGGTSAFRYSL